VWCGCNGALVMELTLTWTSAWAGSLRACAWVLGAWWVGDGRSGLVVPSYIPTDGSMFRCWSFAIYFVFSVLRGRGNDLNCWISGFLGISNKSDSGGRHGGRYLPSCFFLALVCVQRCREGGTGDGYGARVPAPIGKARGGLRSLLPLRGGSHSFRSQLCTPLASCPDAGNRSDNTNVRRYGS
jgi:hypothetical protein